MRFSVGHAGPDVRGDVQVTLEPADRFAASFVSSVAALYGDAIRAQIEAVADRWGRPSVRLHAEDSGALPYVWDARLDAAFALAEGERPRTSRSRTVKRERLRRSRLYVPGDVPKLIQSAPLAGADVVVLDLEDAVPGSRKHDALWMVAHGLGALDFGDAEVAVRVNPGLEDVTALAGSGVDCFWIPKCEHAAQVAEVAAALDAVGSPSLVVPLIETALGVENCREVVGASDRVVAVSLGLEDYLADVGAERTVAQTESAWARGRVLNSAVAAGVTPLASVFPRFDDPEEVFAYARAARAAGYQGVGCIHPAQVEPVHSGFAPTADEMEAALEVVRAYRASSGAATAAGGRMVDEPVYRRALLTLRRGGWNEPA